MSRCEKLLAKAHASANNFRFEDLCKLAECYGWVATRHESSHCMYENDDLEITKGRMMNFQSVKGQAKSYQVKQLLDAIEYLENNVE